MKTQNFVVVAFFIINMTKDGDDYENDDDEVSNKTYRASLAPQTSVN